MSVKVRIKYCGGCNPRFDRKYLVTKLRAAFPQIHIVEMHDESPNDIVAVICGCSVACVDHENLHGRYGKIVITSEKGYDIIAASIKNLITSGGL
jgi:4-hydroxybutyrate CoA-transferase